MAIHRTARPIGDPIVLRFQRLIPLLLLAGCDSPGTRVRVLVPDPAGGEAPAAGLPLAALPYDRDPVLAALGGQAATPRPHTAELDSLFGALRASVEAYARVAALAGRLHDSLAGLRRAMDTLSRRDEAYAALYGRFAGAADSLTRLQRDVAAARVSLDRVSRRLQPRIDSLRRGVRQWEDSAFATYAGLVRRLGGGRPPRTATTGADGVAVLRLGDGLWWIYTRMPDPSDPNMLWAWNLPVRGDSIVLDRGNGVRRPRY